MWEAAASLAGDKNKCKEAIEAGADLEYRSGYYKCTPVAIAASIGHYDVVEYLVESGGRVDTHDRFGRSPVYLAAWNGHLDVVKYLVLDFLTVLHSSRQKCGDTCKCKMLFSEGFILAIRGYLKSMFKSWHIHDETSCGKRCSVRGRGSVVNFPTILYLVVQLHNVNIMMQRDYDY